MPLASATCISAAKPVLRFRRTAVKGISFLPAYIQIKSLRLAGALRYSMTRCEQQMIRYVRLRLHTRFMARLQVLRMQRRSRCRDLRSRSLLHLCKRL